MDKLSLSIRGTARIPAEATGFPFPEGKHAFPGIFPHRRWVGVTSLWPPLFDVGRTVATNISRPTFLHLPAMPNRFITRIARAAARRGAAPARGALRAAARAAGAGRHAAAHRHQPDGGTMAQGHQAMTDDIEPEWLDDLRERIHHAAHRRMLPVLHLDPVLRPARLIRTVPEFRHQAFYIECGPGEIRADLGSGNENPRRDFRRT